MVNVVIKNINLENYENHLATEFQVADNPAFIDPVLDTGTDYKNKLSKFWNVDLDPNKDWYARARVLLDPTGWTTVSNLDISFTKNINDVEMYPYLPSLVSSPIINTSSYVDGHDGTLFDITFDGFEVVGGGVHVGTTCIIEDIFGEVVWYSIDNKINRDKMTINNVLLEEGMVYRIRAMFHSSTNDVSDISTKTIHIGGSKYINLLTYLSSLNVSIDNDISINNIPGFIELNYQFIEAINGINTVIHEGIVNNTEFIIPANTLLENKVYMLKLKTNVENPSKYYIFNTYA